MAAAKPKVVTGASSAWVNCKDGLVRQVFEGDEIPEVDAAEYKRLTEADVFGVHPRDAKAAADNAAVIAALEQYGIDLSAQPIERSAEEQQAKKDTSKNDDDGATPTPAGA
jgi:hypothetical protein